MLVFQYGSNMSSVRLNSPARLQGEAVPLGLAITEDLFDLGFTVFSSQNGCAAADLTPDGSRRIVGVLYEIPESRVLRERSGGLRTLDDVEGEGVAYVRSGQVHAVQGAVHRGPKGVPVALDDHAHLPELEDDGVQRVHGAVLEGQVALGDAGGHEVGAGLDAIGDHPRAQPGTQIQ